jgi:PKD repeat protein
VRSRRIAAIAALSISASSLAALPNAEADAGTTLYVNNSQSAACSDTTTDSATTPYCTIQAAADVVTAGQTIIVAAGTYAPFTITASGTASDPITVQAVVPRPTPSGAGPETVTTISSPTATAAITVSGAHYVNVSGFDAFSSSTTVNGAGSQVSVTGSSDISIDRISATRLGGTADVSPAVEIDGASSAVTVSRSWLYSAAGSAVQIDPGGSDDVITTNTMVDSGAPAIAVNGAADTDITSNAFGETCGHAVVLTGASGGSSIQNNVLENLLDSTTPACSIPAASASGIEVDGSATAGTTVDYNIVYVVRSGDSAYDWAGVDYSTAGALYSAVGQGQHDLNMFPGVSTNGPTTDTSPAVDSANSSAPGELDTDIYGQGRADDPNTANTGVGTAAYYDRGAVERQGSIALSQVVGTVSGITGSVSQAPTGTTMTFTTTGSNSWSDPVYYVYSFGDGTTETTTSNVVTHTYSVTGAYKVTVTAQHAEFAPSTGFSVSTNINIVPPAALTLAMTIGSEGALIANVDTNGSTSAWNITSYNIDFGDGTVDNNGAGATHTYAKPGTYLITLTETDQSGQTATMSKSFTTAGSDYTATGPTRILDTRDGTGTNGVIAPVNPGATLVLHVAGTGTSLPAGVTAVAVNLTATDTTGNGLIIAYPDGTTVPNVSNLNYTPGKTVANSAIVPVDADGSIDLYNAGTLAGKVDLIVDVTGYFTTTAANGYGTVTSGSDRILDTRDGTGTGGTIAQVKPGQSLPLTIAGLNTIGIPATGITAVALNLTVTNTSGSGFVTAYPDGKGVPTASSVDYAKGQTVANAIIVPVGQDGKIDLYNGGTLASKVDLIADVTGFFSAASPAAYVPVTPTRLLDTRQTGAIGSQSWATVNPVNEDSQLLVIPVDYVVNVTATEPTGTGFVTAGPDGYSPPNTSIVNYVPGLTAANLASVEPNLSTDAIDFYNLGTEAGTVQVIVDLFGYYSVN